MIGVSILIVNYNGAKFLRNLFQSIEKSFNSYRFPYELRIFDNASSDESRDIILDEEKRYPITTIFSDVNVGFGKANNILASSARYSNLLLLNNDTKILALDQLINYLNTHQQLHSEVITCVLLNEDKSVQPNVFNANIGMFRLFATVFLLKNYLKRFVSPKSYIPDLKSGYFSGCYFVMSRANYLENNGFDENFFFYHEEADFFLRLEALNPTRMVFRDDRIVHYGGGGGLISKFSFINFFLSLFLLYKKHRVGYEKMLLFIFRQGFRFRILLLRLGVYIPYSPFYKTYKEETSFDRRSRDEVIELHRDFLSDLEKKFVEKQ